MSRIGPNGRSVPDWMTPEVIERAALRLVAEDSERHLRNSYGEFSMSRARNAVTAVLMEVERVAPRASR